MNLKTGKMREFGLVGRNISYSFSRGYFRKKFEQEQVDARYDNFDLENISLLPGVLDQHQDLEGFNVTIPYKEAILPYLDSLHPDAAEIGAVNTVKVLESGRLKGYNTDHLGFSESIRPLLLPEHKKALVLGTGGASRAVVYALSQLGISAELVSRNTTGTRSYEDLDEGVLSDHLVLVNCTPLGTFPEVHRFPPIPLQHLGPRHLVYDLVYNPPVTRLMELATAQGARVSNGQKMLELQAEAAWRIWNRG